MAVAVLLTILLATAGAAWQFGPYGLYGGAALALISLTFVDIRKEDDDG
jgi:hypothetical protein